MLRHRYGHCAGHQSMVGHHTSVVDDHVVYIDSRLGDQHVEQVVVTSRLADVLRQVERVKDCSEVGLV